jgi:transcriptional regulator GlxA family with amidase domain
MKALLIGIVVGLSVISLQGQDGSGSNSEAYYCPPCNNHCDQLTFGKPGACQHCGMALIKQTADERKKTMTEKKMTICFYLQDGVEVLDFAGPMEVFSYSGFDVFTVSKTKKPILSQGILKVIPDYDINDAPEADILAFFGGNSGTASNDEQVIAWVKNQKPDYYFSVCTGAFILGKAGILDNLTATTFHSRIDALRKEFPKAKILSDVRFVDNGNVITTAGISAGIDGALHLVSKLKGEEIAKSTAFYMEYDKWIPNEGLVVKK